ncbi:MFS transporter [Polycladomyces subterraneus]|uniref:MFS transporter n=1 Tax=Polycladomyces subterraneus TaxID=1016997 RepID=A0ABT8IQW7_9BACL|nr:MFS transporter [Polycladomyces subterraneus]MDN4595200.1 MFS transporter [Polycladomyces subterraneus]
MLDKKTQTKPTTEAFHSVKSRLSSLTYLPTRYTIFLAGLLISRLGDTLYAFAIPWISYELTRSAVVMSSLYAINVLPIVLFGPVVGVLVDRWERRRLMLVADVVRAVLVGLVPVLYLLNLLQLWHLYGISFALAVLSLLFDVATVTAIPHMTEQELMKANAAYQMVNQIADLAGPVLAGIVIAAVGGFQTLWLDALSFGATFLAVWRMPVLGRGVSVSHMGNIFQNMAEGLRWLVRDRLNLSLSLQAMIGNFGYFVAFSILMYYLRSTLHLNAKQTGLNFALLGAGGLLGSIIVVPLEKRFRRGILIPVLLSIGTIGFTLAILSPFWLVPGIAFGTVATCNVAWNTLVQSVRQETVPEAMLGRVLSFSRVFTRLAMPLGAMVGGLISNFDPVAVFVVAAVTKGLEVIIALSSPIRKL